MLRCYLVNKFQLEQIFIVFLFLQNILSIPSNGDTIALSLQKPSVESFNFFHWEKMIFYEGVYIPLKY